MGPLGTAGPFENMNYCSVLELAMEPYRYSFGHRVILLSGERRFRALLDRDRIASALSSSPSPHDRTKTLTVDRTRTGCGLTPRNPVIPAAFV